MRLLRTLGNGNSSLVEYFEDIPPYAILSHTWLSDSEEVTFKDILKGRGKSKEGYKKLQFCAQQAAHDELDYFWVDTCCIDKSSSAELSEAINSMFKCPNHGALDIKAFQESRWFTRGWTLQELIAPRFVEFFSSEGKWLGDKDSLLCTICEVTGIPAKVVQGCSLFRYTDGERLSWAKHRNTKREEDAAYSLMGLFDVYMIPIYGEGKLRAFKRLKYETVRVRNDDFYSLWCVWPNEIGNIDARFYIFIRMLRSSFISFSILLAISICFPSEKVEVAVFVIQVLFLVLFGAYVEIRIRLSEVDKILIQLVFAVISHVFLSFAQR